MDLYPRIRRYLRRRGIGIVIPRRSDQKTGGGRAFDKATYRRRSTVECCIGHFKEHRRIGTRYEKYATHYLGMVKIALIRKYVLVLSSDSA